MTSSIAMHSAPQIPRSPQPVEPSREAAWITLAYAATALAWVVLSEIALSNLTTPGPSRFWLDIAKGALLVLGTAALLYVGLRHRLGQFRTTQDHLRLMNVALSGTANAVFIINREGRIEWVNDSFCRLSGYAREELLGKNPSLLGPSMGEEAVDDRLRTTVREGRIWSGEVVARRKDGECYVVQETVTPLPGPDGGVTHFVAIHEDVTARKRAEEQAAFQAFHDALTGLANRTQFQERLPEEMARAERSGRLLAVHFLDLDNFKVINDSLGHAAGDRLLCEVADRLRSCVRSTDLVARLGGDEFALLQVDLTNPDGAASLARKVLNKLSAPIALGENQVQPRGSIGITVYPMDRAEPAKLLQNADMAMYLAKREGRNNYQFFTESLNAEMQTRVQTERDLRRALESGELVVHYQPLFTLADRKTCGLEALVRWRHPTRGLLPAGAFVPVAEECGLISSLTEWVLLEVGHQGQAWRTAGLAPVSIAVNVPAISFRRGQLEAQVNAALTASKFDPNGLELEVTETVLLKERDVLQTIRRLSERGVRFAIDDFGTGWSSLNHLRSLKVGKLKIDSSFVRGLPGAHDDRTIALAIIDLGHSLEMKVLAEGIETNEQLRFLAEHGCDQGQGYLFSAPVPAVEAAAFLKH